jgi:hypothetical protein
MRIASGLGDNGVLLADRTDARARRGDDGFLRLEHLDVMADEGERVSSSRC